MSTDCLACHEFGYLCMTHADEEAERRQVMERVMLAILIATAQHPEVMEAPLWECMCEHE